MRDTATGDQVVVPYDFDYPDRESLLFIWSEGNFSCDCNRGAFFGLDPACNVAENRFALTEILIRETGERITDFEFLNPDGVLPAPSTPTA